MTPLSLIKHILLAAVLALGLAALYVYFAAANSSKEYGYALGQRSPVAASGTSTSTSTSGQFHAS